MSQYFTIFVYAPKSVSMCADPKDACSVLIKAVYIFVLERFDLVERIVLSVKQIKTCCRSYIKVSV